MPTWGHDDEDCAGALGGSWGLPWGFSGPEHTAEAIDRLIEEYKGSDDLKKLICIFAERWDLVDDVAEKVQGTFTLDAAGGVQQDAVGSFIGLSRNLDTDTDYRRNLKVQAQLLLPQGRNFSSAMIKIIRTLLNDPDGLRDIDFVEAYPLGYIIQVDDLTVDESNLLVRFLPFTRPATYQGLLVFANAGGFVYDSDNAFVPQGGGYGTVNDAAMGGGYGHITEI